MQLMALKTKMPTAREKPSFGGRAWRLLRLAVLWARRGSAVHRLRMLKTLRRGVLGSHGLGGRRRKSNDMLRYGECEFSIDETPSFRFRAPSARVLRFIPCIAAPDTPGVYGEDRYFFTGTSDRAVDADRAGYYYGDGGEPSECGVESYDDDADRDELLLERAMMEASRVNVDAEGSDADAGVDVKAEEFIAKFYSQIKMQRQISWLQYNEMMERSIC